MKDLNEESEEFGSLWWRDSLAPFPFVIVLNYAFRMASDRHKSELGITIMPKKSHLAMP